MTKREITNPNAIPPVLPPSARKPRSRWSSRENLVVVLATLVSVGLLAAIAIPSYLRANMRVEASGVLHDMRATDVAKDQYALETGREGDFHPTWDDLKPWIRFDWRPWMKDGKDKLGNPILVGSIAERVRVHPRSKAALLEATGGDAFWGPYS